MATTSPDNIRTPNSGDQYALVQDMGILADTVQNALIKRANAYVGTVSQRTAFTSQAPTGTIWSDTDGDRVVWKKGATEWEFITPEEDEEDVPATTIPYLPGYKGGAAGGSGSLQYRIKNGWVIVFGGGTNNAEALEPGTEYTMAQLPPSVPRPPMNISSGGGGQAGRASTMTVTTGGAVILQPLLVNPSDATWIRSSVVYPTD